MNRINMATPDAKKIDRKPWIVLDRNVVDSPFIRFILVLSSWIFESLPSVVYLILSAFFSLQLSRHSNVWKWPMNSE